MNQPAVTRILLDAGADQTVRGGEFDRTPVESAVLENSLAVTQLYFERNAPISQKGIDNALRYAMSSDGDPEFVALLLKWGAGRDQETPQRAARGAIYYANIGNVGLLFKAGLQLGVNESTLYGGLEDLRGSLERGGDPNEIYVEGESLTEAQYRQWLSQSEARRQVGEFVDAWLMTPIVSAAGVNDIEKARLLLDHGADQNFMTTEVSHSALYQAIVHNNAVLVALLLEHGANPQFSKHDETSPLELAERLGYEACAALLRPVTEPEGQ